MFESPNFFGNCFVSLKEKSYFCRRKNNKILKFMTK